MVSVFLSIDVNCKLYFSVLSSSDACLPVESILASCSWMKGVSLLSATPLSDKTSSRVHGVVSCPVMSCPSHIAVLWAGQELVQGWMTFVTPILVSSLGAVRPPVAQSGTKRTDVMWEVWDGFDHDAPIWAYLLGCYCGDNGGINDMPDAMCVSM